MHGRASVFVAFAGAAYEESHRTSAPEVAGLALIPGALLRLPARPVAPEAGALVTVRTGDVCPGHRHRGAVLRSGPRLLLARADARRDHMPADAADADLRARALTKHFSGVIAVRNVDFTLPPGEIVGYLGPNGSGKSTTREMLTGLVEPSSGRVEYDGRNVRAIPIAFRHGSATCRKSRTSIRFSPAASISS